MVYCIARICPSSAKEMMGGKLGAISEAPGQGQGRPGAGNEASKETKRRAVAEISKAAA